MTDRTAVNLEPIQTMIEHLLTVAQHPDLPWEHRERISTVVVWLTDQLSEQK